MPWGYADDEHAERWIGAGETREDAIAEGRETYPNLAECPTIRRSQTLSQTPSPLHSIRLSIRPVDGILSQQHLRRFVVTDKLQHQINENGSNLLCRHVDLRFVRHQVS